MPQDYSTEQMLHDVMSVIQQTVPQLVPVAVLVGAVAFLIAWFMDSIDLAGKVFGRHR